MTATWQARAAALVLVGVLAACRSDSSTPASGGGPRLGSGSGVEAAPGTARAKRAIEAAVARYVTASNRGDIEALVALYAEDAVLLPPDHGPVEGRQAIADFWRQGTDDGLAITTLRIEVEGDLGYLIGRYLLPATRTEPADSGKYLLCLRRQRDGTWKVAADIWNSSAAADESTDDTLPPADEARPTWRVS